MGWDLLDKMVKGYQIRLNPYLIFLGAPFADSCIFPSFGDIGDTFYVIFCLFPMA